MSSVMAYWSGSVWLYVRHPRVECGLPEFPDRDFGVPVWTINTTATMVAN
jgi:hypothetical protein